MDIEHEPSKRSAPAGHRPRLGAYLLAGDPVWLASSLSRYYDLLDELVVVAPKSGLGWTGRPIRSQECLDIVGRHDRRGIHRVVWGEWQDPAQPMRADTAQRQAGIDALGASVDWILQIDNDEILPHPQQLLSVLDEASKRSIGAVEWPMRVLFRRTWRGSYLEVVDPGGPRYDYPGPIAVRPAVELLDARRCRGPFLRPVVQGDDRSLQLRHEAEDGEVREELLEEDQAIIHNSWARTPASIRRKMATWGHASGRRGQRYYLTTWLPAPLTWPLLRDVHPFARGLWPRLAPTPDLSPLLLPEDR